MAFKLDRKRFKRQQVGFKATVGQRRGGIGLVSDVRERVEIPLKAKYLPFGGRVNFVFERYLPAPPQHPTEHVLYTVRMKTNPRRIKPFSREKTPPLPLYDVSAIAPRDDSAPYVANPPHPMLTEGIVRDSFGVLKSNSGRIAEKVGANKKDCEAAIEKAMVTALEEIRGREQKRKLIQAEAPI